MQKKHMERCLFTLLVLLIFALTILGLYRVTKHSAAPAPPDRVASYAVQGIEVASHQAVVAGCGVNALSGLRKRNLCRPDKTPQSRIRQLLPDAV